MKHFIPAILYTLLCLVLMNSASWAQTVNPVVTIGNPAVNIGAKAIDGARLERSDDGGATFTVVQNNIPPWQPGTTTTYNDVPQPWVPARCYRATLFNTAGDDLTPGTSCQVGIKIRPDSATVTFTQ